MSLVLALSVTFAAPNNHVAIGVTTDIEARVLNASVVKDPNATSRICELAE